jgi:hypothetical protein
MDWGETRSGNYWGETFGPTATNPGVAGGPPFSE